MKKILLLLALVLLIGCQADFKANFNKFEKISAKYDTSFFNEKLNGSEVPLTKIEPLITDIESVEVSDNASIRFKAARINMLKSELYWQLARDIGSIGRADDGFYCKEKEYLERAGDYFNKTHYYGLNAYNSLDLLLRDFPEYQDIIGIGNNKTRFYSSPIFWAGERAKYNTDLFKQVCLIKQNVSSLPVINLTK